MCGEFRHQQVGWTRVAAAWAGWEAERSTRTKPPEWEHHPICVYINVPVKQCCVITNAMTMKNDKRVVQKHNDVKQLQIEKNKKQNTNTKFKM